MVKPAKRHLRVPRVRGQSDEAYHRTVNRTLRNAMKDSSIPDLDVYVLARMYDYTGHLAEQVRTYKTLQASFFVSATLHGKER